jgi:putative copper export protein
MVDILLQLGQSPFSLAMATSPWVVPTMQSLHIMAIAIIFTSVLVVAGRIYGLIWADVSIQQTASRFTPWAFGALAVLVCTGIVLVLAEPVREILALSFWLKMVLLAASIVIALRFIKKMKANETEATPAMRRAAVATIVLLICIVFLGRFIGYDPLIWGSLSPITHI